MHSICQINNKYSTKIHDREKIPFAYQKDNETYKANLWNINNETDICSTSEF